MISTPSKVPSKLNEKASLQITGLESEKTVLSKVYRPGRGQQGLADNLDAAEAKQDNLVQKLNRSRNATRRTSRQPSYSGTLEAQSEDVSPKKLSVLECACRD